MALGAALPRAPRPALRPRGDTAGHFDLTGVCSGEILLDDVDTARSDAINRRHQVASRAALERVAAPDLTTRRNSSLAAIRQMR
jgi:hypothetical protein